MVDYKSPCDTCPKNYTCGNVECSIWRKQYMLRQRQINAYAKKVLPGYYERQQRLNGGTQDGK